MAATEAEWYLSGAPTASPNAMSPPPSPPPLDYGPLEALVRASFPGAPGPYRFTPMPGGASTRRYVRAHAGASTAVGMYVPEGPRAEEVVHAGAVPAKWPFLEVHDLLASRGIDVPRLHGAATAQGWLLLEDLGDDTLAEYLVAHPDAREALYVRAVTDLANAQRVLADLPPGSIVGSRAFDQELLAWELRHFREWALEARGYALAPTDRAAYDHLSERLAARIAALPRVFVHRDYQSRNLMVRAPGTLCWIDFQDALIGPRVYDLVALLNDSYQSFDRSFVEARLGDYARAAGLSAVERTDLVREFDLVTVQRKLKDAGRFVFIDRVKGNGSFLRFVEPTIQKARASAARLPDDPDVRELMQLVARLLPE